MNTERRAIFCVAHVKEKGIIVKEVGIDLYDNFINNKVAKLVGLYKQFAYGGISNIAYRNSASTEDLGRMEDLLNTSIRKIEFAVVFRNDIGSHFPNGNIFVYYTGNGDYDIAKNVLLRSLAMSSVGDLELIEKIIDLLTTKMPSKINKSDGGSCVRR